MLPLMPALLRFDAAETGSSGWANTSFVLSCGNWVFAANALMNPWVHLETRHQNFSAIEEGAEVAVQMVVEDFFEKKGHQFADVRVNLFSADQPRAIGHDLAARHISPKILSRCGRLSSARP